MRLSCSGLAVGENSSVVAFEDGSDGMLGRRLVNLLLSRVHVVNMVEAVRVPHRQVRVDLHVLGFFAVIDLPAEILHNRDRATIGRHLHDGEEETSRLLTLQRRSESDDDVEVVDALVSRGALARLECIRGDVRTA